MVAHLSIYNAKANMCNSRDQNTVIEQSPRGIQSGRKGRKNLDKVQTMDSTLSTQPLKPLSYCYLGCLVEVIFAL